MGITRVRITGMYLFKNGIIDHTTYDKILNYVNNRGFEKMDFTIMNIKSFLEDEEYRHTINDQQIEELSNIIAKFL